MERPIIFSSEMVRAILEDKKTQTRRVIKPQPTGNDLDILTRSYGGAVDIYNLYRGLTAGDMGYEQTTIKCPYGQPDDRLWVRETWDVFALPNEVPSICYRADSTAIPILGKLVINTNEKIILHKWRPSIHMPRWASRITLEIVNIRVERVQDISEEDAMAEGAPLGRVLGYGRLGMQSYREGFIDLWNSINLERGFGWDSNCWVWVIEFKRIENEN